MEPTVYSLQFRGRTAQSVPGTLRASAEAIGADGKELRFESEVAFSSETTFREEGTIDFGGGNRLRFRTLGLGRLAPSPFPGLKHGAVIREVDGGDGGFEAAQGFITSNFVVTDLGEVTDNQVGVVFVR